MKNIFIMFVLGMFLLSGCGEEATKSESDKDEMVDTVITSDKYEKELYGSWKFIHNAKEIYIVSTTEILDGYRYKLIDDNLLEFTLLEDENIKIFALRTSSLKAKINGRVDFLKLQESAKLAGRSVEDIGDISLILVNLLDDTIKATPELVEVDYANVTQYTNIAGGDVVVVEDGTSSGLSQLEPVEVVDDEIENAIVTQDTDLAGRDIFVFEDESLPSGDYTLRVVYKDEPTTPIVEFQTVVKDEIDLGVATVVEEVEVEYNFKASVEMSSDRKWDNYIYGDFETRYKGSINIKNIGKYDGLALSYVVSSSNPYVSKLLVENKLGTLEPEDVEKIPFEISFKYLDKISEDIKININITDGFGTTWMEHVTLRVWKRPIQFNVKANESDVKGYLAISDDELITLNTQSDSFYVPYQPDKNYFLYLSNPEIANETTYTVGVDTNVLDMSDFRDTGIYEPNETKTTASTININNAIVSYLHKGDLDVYKIDMSDSREIQEITSLHYNAISPLYDTDGYAIGNSDEILNKGETALFNISIENKGASQANNVVVELSTKDSYVSVINNRLDYRTETFRANGIEDNKGYTVGDSYYLQKTNYAGFSVSADESTPDGHITTIDIKMTDEFGNVWNDSFSITVGDIGADLHYNAISPLYDTDGYAIGNSDEILNKGETALFNISIENKGASQANNVVVELSTKDSYVSVINNRLDYRTETFRANGIEDNKGYTVGDSYYLQKTNYAGFSVSADESTPDGHITTIDIKMTDEFGNVWNDSFTITVN
ncbi:MAG: hypothetical protein U9P72_07595 [Campylobacterota bacterium]|nr:hypothetical protein [Campylobacterota bacterium]